MSHEKAIFDGVRTRLGVRKSREMPTRPSRMFKRAAMVAVTVLIAAGVSLALSSPVGSVAGFGDVPEQSFYTDAVQWMVDNDITTGTSATCFSPNDAVTRGQAAAFM